MHPPRPRLTLNVGITGHRTTVLSDELVELARPIIETVFRDLQKAAFQLFAEEQSVFSEEQPKLRLHTPLATGADQLAATVARTAGFQVRALLPFVQEEYREDFEKGDERREFLKQLANAEEVFALPSEAPRGESAYVQVGKGIVAASDILIAVWDGGEANGPGGTAHVVDLALSSSVPIIHVPVDIEANTVGAPQLLVGRDIIDFTSYPVRSAEDWLKLLRDTLAPHGEEERENIRDFYAEVERTSNWRIEYPLLLALLGVKKLPKRFWRQNSIEADIAQDWKDVRGVDRAGTRQPLERSYAWANFLAIRYAQLFRSGHVSNYVLSALAVNFALLGLLVPHAKVFLVLAELGVIGLLFLNTRAGRRGEWHRRWLQYRYLAETLRPLIYLKRTSMISPPSRSDFVLGQLHSQSGADWTRWYSAAIWRQMDWPVGHLDGESIRRLAEEVLAEQILPQAAYHQVNAERMHKLDHRLHEIGNFLTGAVIAACSLYLIGYLVVPGLVKLLTGPFIFLTAGLPAISASVFGMRGHGEHLLAASRSSHTVRALNATAERIRRATKLEPLAKELEMSAAIMLSDLNDWTAAYRERSLEIPG